MIKRSLPSVFIILLVIIGISLLCCLGCWQLSRASQKKQILASVEAAQTKTPLQAQQLLANPAAVKRYDPVFLRGTFLNEQSILLDNKTNNGKVGYHLLVPFLLDDRTVILINRGWIPAGPDRKHLPIIQPIIGEATIEGYLDFAYRNPFIKNAVEKDDFVWPLRIQQIDNDYLQKVLGKRLYPMLVILNNHSENVFMSPARHIGYAIQWFALAATLLLFSVFTYFRSRGKHEFNHCKQK